MTEPFTPTHRVPSGGLPAWREPDPNQTAVATLDPGLDVRRVEQRDDGWAHIVCANDWAAWVDGRQLEPLEASAPGAPFLALAGPDAFDTEVFPLLQNLLGSGEQTPPAAIVPTPNPEPPPVQAPPAPRPQPQTPTPQPQPAPAPTPQCTYPNSIGVQGGSGSLGPQGGSFTVTDPNVVLSTGGLVNCGKHYQLGFSDGSASGYDCKTSGFNYNISNSVKVGDSVSVAFRLPPNSCN
jgi:hypothetical protein